jgi:hypothetical protein
MANDEWRSVEVLKLLRQCVICPQCGVLVTTQAGINAHIEWHNQLGQYVQSIDDKFQVIHDYVRGDGGMEDQIIAALTQLRTDATNAITQLRTDATNAITALSARVTALENQ